MTSETTVPAIKKKSPMLTDLEKVVFNYCVETGHRPGGAIEEDAVMHRLIVEKIKSGIRADRVQEKLNGNVAWLQKRLAHVRETGEDV